MGHPIHKHMSSGMKSAERYDAKEAYNKDLSSKARMHYLENDIADKKGMSRQASPLNIDGGKAKHEKHIGRKLDDETWGGHTQTEKHHRGPSRKGSPARVEGGRKDHKMSNSEYSAHLQSPKGKKEHGAGMSRYGSDYSDSPVELTAEGKKKIMASDANPAFKKAIANSSVSRKASPANNINYGTGYIGDKSKISYNENHVPQREMAAGKKSPNSRKKYY